MWWDVPGRTDPRAPLPDSLSLSTGAIWAPLFSLTMAGERARVSWPIIEILASFLLPPASAHLGSTAMCETCGKTARSHVEPPAYHKSPASSRDRVPGQPTLPGQNAAHDPYLPGHFKGHGCKVASLAKQWSPHKASSPQPMLTKRMRERRQRQVRWRTD